MSQLTTGQIREDIINYLTENFPLFDINAPDETPMPEHGIDSLGITMMVLYFEDHFGVKVLDSELTRENLGNIRSLIRYVTTKLKVSE